MEEEGKISRELHDFYHHLGTLIIEGSDILDRKEDQKDWISILSKSGYPELANHYENLLLTRSSDTLYNEGIVNLINATGEKLRASIRQLQDEDEIAYRTEYIQCDYLPKQSELPEIHGDDISFLTNLLNVGSLPQKRLAAQALGNFLLRKKDPANKSMREEAASILNGNKDPEIAFEVAHALSFAPGSEGKRAKVVLNKAGKFMSRLMKDVVSYWDGLLAQEPILHLNSDETVTLGIWMRLASDYVAGHVGEILIDLLAGGDEKKVSSYISAFVYSADRRMLPVFIRILQDGTLPSKIEAIKAIAHIDDPRSYGALEKAFRHSTEKLEKIVLARALARMGSQAHAGYLTEVLKTEKKPENLEEVLKATGESEKSDDETRELVIGYLESDNPVITRAAIRALAGIGNENDIETLSRAAEKNTKMRAVVKAATQTLYSRIILRGSEIVEKSEKPRPAERKRKKVSLRARLLSGLYYLYALLCLVFKKPLKSLKYVERSLSHNSHASYSYFFRAYAFYSMNNLEMAIDSYRQAVSVDAGYTWRRPDDADRLIRAYLKRSQQIEDESNAPQEAFLLLEELNDIDLRKADPNLKIELVRRLDYLKYTRMRASESVVEE